MQKDQTPLELRGYLLRFWCVADQGVPSDTDAMNPNEADAWAMLEVLSKADSESSIASWIRSSGQRGCAALRDASVQYAHLEYGLVVAPGQVFQELTPGLELNAETFRSAGASAFFRRAIKQYAWNIREMPPEGSMMT